MKRNAAWLCVFTVLFGIAPTYAYAYLDPGTGSVLLQGAIAAIAGGLLAVRSYWARIVGLFRGADTERVNSSQRRVPKDHA